MKLPFTRTAPQRELRRPQPSLIPEMKNSSICALYRAARVGGDFFDFVVTDSGRLLFLLMDVAGNRDEALDIAAAVQHRLRSMVPELFADGELNEAEAITALLVELNRELIRAAGGVRCAPAFIGCYRESYGTLTYINAGHTPALLRDYAGVTVLGANGIPLGLFSHATHDARISALRPGAALVLVSRGLVESKAGSREFGLERLKQVMAAADAGDAKELCVEILDAVKTFTESSWRKKESENDVTTLSLVRVAERAAAAAG